MNKEKFSIRGKEWTMYSPKQSMYEILSDMINTDLFLLMIENAKFSPLLQEDEEYTVFIPIDSFFIKNHDKIHVLYETPWCTQQLVMNHFVKGKHFMAGEKNRVTLLQTFQGSEVIIENQNGFLKINGMAVFLDMDIECRNGVIHLIDRFLVPSPDVFNLPPEKFLNIVE